MLQTLRNHAQGWIASVIVAILCFAFALWGIEYYISGQAKPAIAITINGIDIPQVELDFLYNRMKPQVNQSVDSLNQLRSDALEKLIVQEVMAQAAKKDGFVISRQQIGHILAQMTAFQVQGQFSPSLFQNVISKLYPSEQSFMDNVTSTAALIQERVGIANTDFALPSEIKRQAMLEAQKRSFNYLIIPSSRFLSNIKISDQQIIDYYRQHLQNYQQPESVKINYIQLNTKEFIPQVVISDAEISQYYSENKSAFSNKTLDDSHQAIKKILIQQKVESLFAQASEQLANLSYTNPNSLKVAAETLKLPIQTSEWFSRQGEKTGIMANPQVIAAAFSDNALKQRNNSDLIQLDDQSVLVLRVLEHKTQMPRPLIEVREDITSTLKSLAAQKESQNLGKKIIAQLKNGTSQDNLSLPNDLKWTHVDLSTQEEQIKKISPFIVKYAFSLPAFNQGKESVGGLELPDQNTYVVIVLTRVELPEAKNFQQNKTEEQNLRNTLAALFGNFAYQLYQASKMREAKIHYSK